MKKNTLDFDIVIVTRNRLDALSMSIPLMLGQSRTPVRLIVIDSSDDHSLIKNLVLDATKDWKGEVIIEHESIPSITRQRNKGLKYVKEEIVFFPDDDSLWHPNVAESIMQVYERDTEKVIGGVCAKPVAESPIESMNFTYKKSFKSYIKLFVQPLRNKIEKSFFPKPFNLYAYEKWASLPVIPWLDVQNSVVVENMAGFRMTFRAAVIKSLGFDENIGYKVGYAQHEDMDASLHVLSDNLHLVAALDAKVYHHVHPSKRAHGFSYGFCQIANYLYIVKKHMGDNSLARKALSRFMLYKMFVYLMGAFEPYNRQIFKGALHAWNNRSVILDSDISTLAINYKKLMDEHLTKVV